jgi:23S rRNA (uracil1939-C5)-methyltransferase
VFVSGALPGEQVVCQFLSQKAKTLSAKVLQVKEASSHRVEPFCSVYEACGGCDWQHIEPDQQLRYKQLNLSRALSGAGLEPPAFSPAIRSAPVGYRHRLRLAVWRDKHSRYSLGMRQSGSKTVVALSGCPVATQPISRLIAPLQQWLDRYQCHRCIGHIELLDSQPEVGMHVRLTSGLGQQAATALQALCQSRGVILWCQGPDETSDRANAEQAEKMHYSLSSQELTLAFQPTDFTQINGPVNAAMVDQAVSWLGGGTASAPRQVIADLFCGIGNFTLPLARAFGQVIGVELHADMVVQAEINADNNGIKNASFCAADLASKAGVRKLLDQLAHCDGVLLDPPRAGAEAILAEIVKLQVAKLVYVSCQPQTFVRDARLLNEAGYRLVKIGLVDMFAQTHHCESMALFERYR